MRSFQSVGRDRSALESTRCGPTTGWADLTNRTGASAMPIGGSPRRRVCLSCGFRCPRRLVGCIQERKWSSPSVSTAPGASIKPVVCAHWVGGRRRGPSCSPRLPGQECTDLGGYSTCLSGTEGVPFLGPAPRCPPWANHQDCRGVRTGLDFTRSDSPATPACPATPARALVRVPAGVCCSRGYDDGRLTAPDGAHAVERARHHTRPPRRRRGAVRLVSWRAL